MSTLSKATIPNLEDTICQGDIFKNVKYNYIESESNETVDIIEYEFPLAVVISQACDVVAMDDIITDRKGKPTKFMPSVLLCPIYDADTARKGDHISDLFANLSLTCENEHIINSAEWNFVKKDWHYRFHALNVVNSENDRNTFIKDSVIDFKHYFSVPMSFLVSHKADRLYHLDDLFAEQLTLKFATFLSRVAIPD